MTGAINSAPMAAAIAQYVSGPVGSVAGLVALQARERHPMPIAVKSTTRGAITYAGFDPTDRPHRRRAAARRRERGRAVAIVAAAVIDYAAVFLAHSASVPRYAARAVGDRARARGDDRRLRRADLFLDATPRNPRRSRRRSAPRVIGLDDSAAGTPFGAWLAPEGATPQPVTIARPTRSTSSIPRARPARPRASCSATRCAGRTSAAPAVGLWPDAVTMISTPLYSNTTLVSFLPTLGWRRHGRC